MSTFNISGQITELAQTVQDSLAERFREIDRVAESNSRRVLEAFHAARVSDSAFAGTTGYGYNDLGRDAIDAVFAATFGTEAALVRIGFVSGTHAISAALFAALAPGDTLLSVTGAPYDTLQGVIGVSGKSSASTDSGDLDNSSGSDDFDDSVGSVQYGSLKYYGVNYREVALLPDGSPDLDAIRDAASDSRVKAVFIQRSRGYSARRALQAAEIGQIVEALRGVNPDAVTIVDNCYGEFVEEREPSHFGADIMAGSLIKNPGGGLALTGGYIVGKSNLVQRAAFRLTAPGIGGHSGATLGQNRAILQGFFLAPHTVAQALKSAVFCAAMLEHLGYAVSPRSDEPRSDIIQSIELGSAQNLLRFCAGIQHAAPIDSFVTPEPWLMPGYNDPVIMAAGTFIQGASIELSADAPLREPYRVYLQGGLTYESAKIGIMLAVSEMLADN